MHSWLPYAKQPIRAARSRLQGDGGRKFKVDTEKERESLWPGVSGVGARQRDAFSA